MKNGLIIPCFNEAQRIDLQAFSSFIKKENKIDICFVDDGSKDNTFDILKDFSEKFKEKVQVLKLEKNSGKAEAVRRGAQEMLNNKNYSSIGFIDADLSTSLDQYKLLVEEHQSDNTNKVILGSRKATKGNEIKQSPIRKIISNVTRALIRLIIGLPISDTQCGAKVFDSNIAILCFADTFLSRWLFDVEMLLRIVKNQGRSHSERIIKEVPLSRWEHVDGSKISFLDSIKIPLQLLNISANYLIKPIIAFEVKRVAKIFLAPFIYTQLTTTK